MSLQLRDRQEALVNRQTGAANSLLRTNCLGVRLLLGPSRDHRAASSEVPRRPPSADWPQLRRLRSRGTDPPASGGAVTQRHLWWPSELWDDGVATGGAERYSRQSGPLLGTTARKAKSGRSSVGGNGQFDWIYFTRLELPRAR